MTANNPLNLDNFSPIDGKYYVFEFKAESCFEGRISYLFSPAFTFSQNEFLNIVSWLSNVVEAYKWELYVKKEGNATDGYKFTNLQLNYNGVDGSVLAEKLNQVWLKRFNLVLCPCTQNSIM